MPATDQVPGITTDANTHDHAGPTTQVGPSTRPRPLPATPLKRFTKIAMAVISLVSLLEALAFSGTYLLVSRHYVSTDNAQIDGDQVAIKAPIPGAVIDWAIGGGSTVRTNQIVGRIRAVGGRGQLQRVIRSPGPGTIAVSSVVNGQYVTAGTTLATAYNPDKIYITARVDETDVGAVRVGAPVEITVDAYPHASVTGIVSEIQGSTAGRFTIWPNPDTDPTNPQRVDQYVPVKIAITDSGGVRPLPGMNVTARIRRS